MRRLRFAAAIGRRVPELVITHLCTLPDPILPVGGIPLTSRRLLTPLDDDTDWAAWRREQEVEASRPRQRAWRGHIFEPQRLAPRPFNRAGCAFSVSYYRRPWSLLADLWHEGTQMWHRACYGWAPEDTWNMDHTLAEVVPAMLRYLKDHSHTLGYFPEREALVAGCGDEVLGTERASARADAWLEAMAAAWDTYRGLLAGHAPRADPRWARVHAAFRDLVDHLEYLWD